MKRRWVTLGLAGVALNAGCASASAAGGAGGVSTTGSSSTSASTATASGSSSTGFDCPLPAPGPSDDTPTTCTDAAAGHSYIGCEFYPTITPNLVWSIFDFAVAVANGGTADADVSVTRGGQVIASKTVGANGVGVIYLPWIPELKGPDASPCSIVVASGGSVRVPGGAYHLTSSVPVAVYQFSPLEFAPYGGPPGKDWSSCPATQCKTPYACLSYTNDASLLLPINALATSYRITSYHGWPQYSVASALVITGTADGTTVTLHLASDGVIAAGADIPMKSGGDTVSFPIGAGEVVEVVSTPNGDLSGSLLLSDKPVQVLHGTPAINVPDAVGTADHLEEIVPPARALGRHYVMAPPTSPTGGEGPQLIRFVGNVNGTHLTYDKAAESYGLPTVLDAGQVVEIDTGGVGRERHAFEVSGDHEFAMTTFLEGYSVDTNFGMNPGDYGDPAMSVATPVEQFRRKYVFFAPLDYPVTYLDVVERIGTTLTFDGGAVSGPPAPIEGTCFAVVRLKLPLTHGGAHVIEASSPIGIQVIGYGSFTSYQYPGGMNVDPIAPPPTP